MTENPTNEYAHLIYKEVQGFDVNGQNLIAINLLAQKQLQLGVTGDLMEIGVFHGRTAMLLGLLLNKHEKFIAIDAFSTINQIQHEDRQVDLDYYGDGNEIKSSFLKNWEQYVQSKNPNSSHPILIEKDSRDIESKSLRSMTQGVRIFSLDGGHSEASTFHDLELAEEVLTEGGILILDDYFLEDCPAVSVGAMRYFLNRKSKLVPFLIFCGRIFFTTQSHVNNYREAVLSGSIMRWVRFGEFLGQPMICLIDRLEKNPEEFKKDVAEWRQYMTNYLQIKTQS